MAAGTFNVIRDFGNSAPKDAYLSMDPYWIIAIVRVGVPLSFDRGVMASVTKDVALGALTRTALPLIITDDVLHVDASATKGAHTTSLNATLKSAGMNYLMEILPGDYVFYWQVNNKADYTRLLAQLGKGAACNAANDGLKHFGRAHSIRKQVQVSADGVKSASYHLRSVGFSELDSYLYYDWNLASSDVQINDIGAWLTRFGIEYANLFKMTVEGGSIRQDNVGELVTAFINLIIGKGPPKSGAIIIAGTENENATSTPQIANSAPFAYLVPLQVGKIFGVESGSKASRVMCYGDLLETVVGIQAFSSKASDARLFCPDTDLGTPGSETGGRRHVTGKRLKGTFLPLLPPITNIPLWSLLEQFSNKALNEMVVGLNVNREGRIMPTLVVRQIPFTTDLLDTSVSSTTTTTTPGEVAPASPQAARKRIRNPMTGKVLHQRRARVQAATTSAPIVTTTTTVSQTNVTRFLDMPRWVIPSVMVQAVDIGRDDTRRFNFIHVYCRSAAILASVPQSEMIVENPPIRDDIDIMRSGMRSYQATVEAFLEDQIGRTPRLWMNLIGDFLMGGHLTLNGSISCVGIQSAISPGQNILFDDVVYHIEGVSHQASIDGMGHKHWSTHLQVCNGMRASDEGQGFTDNEIDAAYGLTPIYPGFEPGDNTGYDPGLSLEQDRTTGGEQIGHGEEWSEENQQRKKEEEEQADFDAAIGWIDGGD